MTQYVEKKHVAATVRIVREPAFTILATVYTSDCEILPAGLLARFLKMSRQHSSARYKHDT